VPPETTEHPRVSLDDIKSVTAIDLVFVRLVSLSSSPTSDYLRDFSSRLDRGYDGICVTHACRLAELLLAEGKNPWIGRLRDVRQIASGTFHGPLMPTRLAGPNCPTWTTHYVTCEGVHAYDPLIGSPTRLAEYAVTVFGRELTIECFLDAAATAELCRRQELMTAFRVQRVTERSVAVPNRSD
jgi:hypothetical protein